MPNGAAKAKYKEQLNEIRDDKTKPVEEKMISTYGLSKALQSQSLEDKAELSEETKSALQVFKVERFREEAFLRNEVGKAALNWLHENGKAEDLRLLQRVRESGSPWITLIDRAEMAIRSRYPETLSKHTQPSSEPLLQEESNDQEATTLFRYRIFCSPNEAHGLPQEVQKGIRYSYPAYLIADFPKFFAAAVKKSYPTERLDVTIPPSVLYQAANNPSANPFPAPAPYLNQEPYCPAKVFMKEQIISFAAPLREEWKQVIEDLGAKFLQPLGGFSFVITTPNPTVLQAIRHLIGEIEDVTPFQPQIAVAPEYLKIIERKQQDIFVEPNDPDSEQALEKRLAAQGIPVPGLLKLSFFTPDQCQQAAEKLSRQEVFIVDRVAQDQLLVDLTGHPKLGEAWDAVCRQPGLRRVGQKRVPVFFNDVARRVLIEGKHDSVYDLTWTGVGEIIAIADSGLDTGDVGTLHPDFRGRVKAIKSYPIDKAWDAHITNPGADKGPSDPSGHGTHVAGSALGSGAHAESQKLEPIRGMAPGATLVFQSVVQPVEWNEDSKRRGKVDGLGHYGLPDPLDRLFEDAYQQGARIHSNSWGIESQDYDDDWAAALDSFMWEHKDFLVIVAAGNSGKHKCTDRDCESEDIESRNIASPGLAKNCLTVGASENYRHPIGIDATYGNFPHISRLPYPPYEPRFPHPPHSINGLADSIDDIAAFSSRGPTSDGRIKPDVLAPGTFILSTRSSRMPADKFAWGKYDEAPAHYMYNGGTSMATPLVAGCAALVRQYLRETKQFKAPSAALIKAVLIHCSGYIPAPPPLADCKQGWGRLNLKTCLDPAPGCKVRFIDEDKGLKHTSDPANKAKRLYTAQVTNPATPLRATLVYTDYPGKTLINNLNLFVYAPGGGKYYVGNDFNGSEDLDNVNNVESVLVLEPAPGEWRVEIVASHIGSWALGSGDAQDFALVISYE